MPPRNACTAVLAYRASAVIAGAPTGTSKLVPRGVDTGAGGGVALVTLAAAAWAAGLAAIHVYSRALKADDEYSNREIT
jgi:hypothetical protein